MDEYLKRINALAVKSFVKTHAYDLLKIMPNLLLIYHRNANGTIAFVNNNWYKVMGYSEDEVLGQSFLNFLHRDDIDQTLAFYTNSLRQPIPPGLEFQNRYMTKSGEVIHIDWNASIELPIDAPLAAAVGRVTHQSI